MRLANWIASFLVAASSLSASADEWNVATDFTANYPGGAWSYGFFRYPLSPTGGDLPTFVSFEQMLASVDDAPRIGYWIKTFPGGQTRIARLGLEDRVLMSPGISDNLELYAPVVRWTAPKDGSFDIKADFTYVSNDLITEPFVQAGVNLDATSLASFRLETSEDVLVVRRREDLNFGQHLDFFVTRGANEVAMSVRISDVPEPDAWALLSVAGLVLLIKGSRYRRLIGRPARWRIHWKALPDLRL
jgi:hypothetical protein